MSEDLGVDKGVLKRVAVAHELDPLSHSSRDIQNVCDSFLITIGGRICLFTDEFLQRLCNVADHLSHDGLKTVEIFLMSATPWNILWNTCKGKMCGVWGCAVRRAGSLVLLAWVSVLAGCHTRNQPPVLWAWANSWGSAEGLLPAVSVSKDAY